MKHIIIVEDNDAAAFLLQTQLGKLGFLSSVCINMFIVLDKVKNEMVDAVIVDIGLPEVSGLEIIKHIREIDKKVLIVVVSGYSADSDRIQAFQLGANYYLTKPYSPSDLKTILECLK